MRESIWRKSLQIMIGSGCDRRFNRTEARRRPPLFMVEELEGRLTPAAPVVLSISRVTPTPPSANTVLYNVAFDQPVTGVNAADFKVTYSGSLAGAPTLVVAGSGAAYTVIISGIRGSGDLRLDLVDDDSVMAGGLTLGGTGASNGSFQGRHRRCFWP